MNYSDALSEVIKNRYKHQEVSAAMCPHYDAYTVSLRFRFDISQSDIMNERFYDPIRSFEKQMLDVIAPDYYANKEELENLKKFIAMLNVKAPVEEKVEELDYHAKLYLGRV